MDGDAELREAIFDIREKLARLDERMKNVREGQKNMKSAIDMTRSDMKNLGVRSAENRKDIDWNRWGLRLLLGSVVALVIGLIGIIVKMNVL